MDQVLEGGFATPVHDAQRAFRAILDALANPGRQQRLALPADGAALSPDLVSVLLTLADHDTSIWLDETLRSTAIETFIRFHSGAPMVTELQRAQFAFASAGALPTLDAFNLGTQEYPDRSTTIVLAVPSLEGGPALRLKGPGIETSVTIAPQGLPTDFVAQWSDNRELFPRGIDLLLVSGGAVLGLPRSTRIEEA